MHANAPANEPHAEARHTLRVDFDKLDALLNLVGELILTKGRLTTSTASLGAFERELAAELRRARSKRAAGKVSLDDLDRFARVFAALASDLNDGTGALDRVAGDLRQQVMKLRMVPIARVFNKYGRVVRELAHGLGKQVRLELDGAETELDKVLVEQLDDPLLHLVRNSVDHGVETLDARAAAGKPPEGVVRLSARHQGNQVVIEVRDDGAGIHPDKLRKEGAGEKPGRSRRARGDGRQAGARSHLPAWFLDGGARHRPLRPRRGHGRGAHHRDQAGRLDRDRLAAWVWAPPSRSSCRSRWPSCRC